jgi:hypothetical protein
MVLLGFLSGSSLAQRNEDLQRLAPKKFISLWEVFVGANWTIPNDHGFSEYYRNASQNTMTYEFKPRDGYFMGVGLAHVVNKSVDIVGRVYYEKRNYSQENTASYPSQSVDSKNELSNDYLAFSLMPRFHYKKRIYVGLGASYGKHVKYVDRFSQYVNGKLTSQSTITNSSGLDMNTFDLNFCLGYFIRASKSNALAIQVASNYGIADLYNANHLRLSTNGLSASLFFIHQRKNANLLLP